MERLLRNLYGSTPQIDLDRKFARVRVERPMVLDFPALVDGLKRNNVGFGGVWIQAELDVKDGQAVFPETGQRFPVDGEAPAGRAVRRFDVRDATQPARTRLVAR